MSHLIFGHDQALAGWAARKIPHVGEVGFGPCVAIGIASGPDSDDKLLGVCVFHDWIPSYGTMQCSMVATTPRWATKGTIAALLFYVFRQAGARKLWVAIPHRNERALNFCKGIGFTKEGSLRDHFGRDSHAVICRMLRSEYEHGRWCLPEQHQAAA
jgi:RimJ/RimL family protein N-acetyltransferase